MSCPHHHHIFSLYTVDAPLLLCLAAAVGERKQLDHLEIDRPEATVGPRLASIADISGSQQLFVAAPP
jgi:hypothetical protein